MLEDRLSSAKWLLYSLHSDYFTQTQWCRGDTTSSSRRIYFRFAKFQTRKPDLIQGNTWSFNKSAVFLQENLILSENWRIYFSSFREGHCSWGRSNGISCWARSCVMYMHLLSLPRLLIDSYLYSYSLYSQRAGRERERETNSWSSFDLFSYFGRSHRSSISFCRGSCQTSELSHTEDSYFLFIWSRLCALRKRFTERYILTEEEEEDISIFQWIIHIGKTHTQVLT